FTFSTAGTPPNWLDANLVSAYYLTGYNWPAGRKPHVLYGLGALSATEAQEWTAGRSDLPGWMMHPGSAVGSITGANNANFAAGIGNWFSINDSVVSYDAVDEEMDITFSSSSAGLGNAIGPSLLIDYYRNINRLRKYLLIVEVSKASSTGETIYLRNNAYTTDIVGFP